ncbi:hypothetical protein [Bradyrhizobium ganzhouense]|uniref:hypothetical protein n=1 Tax=Bradyrhizobium ganzhouense TaxID=1179767 RepID=UPI003CF844D0
MFNVAYRAAPTDMLYQGLEAVEFAAAKEPAQKSFTTKNARKEVAGLLRRFNFNESAIEAEAMKGLGAELDMVDRLLTSLELRGHRAMRG